ncbi:MAG: SLC13 family permease [Verrucomicrobiota bacterium]
MIMVLGVLALVLLAFLLELASPDIIAMSAFCALFVFGVVPVADLLTVFSNSAPITIACMFIVTAALEKSGAIDDITHLLSKHLPAPLRLILLIVTLFVGVSSAFVNNTPIVALFMPVLLALARERGLAASKLLIPLSYASIMGGSCTLIGTSTNIIVSGIASKSGFEPFGFFELAWIGVPILTIGVVYLTIVGPWLLPERQSLTAVLSPEDRRQQLCQVLIKPDSILIGEILTDTRLATNPKEFRILQVRRDGKTLLAPMDKIKIRKFDRILISASQDRLEKTAQGQYQLQEKLEDELGLQSLSTIAGSIIEGVISPHSSLLGKSIRNINFRQKYGMLVLALHRHGQNLSKNFLDEKLEFGDTLLLLGSVDNFAELQEQGDFMLLEDDLPRTFRRPKAKWAWLAIASVVTISAANLLPIVAAGLLAVLFVLMTKCLDSEEAYKAVDWQIIFLIYGMLGVGVAMESSGAAQFIANETVGLAEGIFPAVLLPYAVLSLTYLLTTILTEMMSNNATAVVMAPIAIGIALALGVDPRPFIIVVAIASSEAFVTPIGYQTNTMVYGVGGYKFSDYVRIGLPLSLILWVTASLLIPVIWPFQP